MVGLHQQQQLPGLTHAINGASLLVAKLRLGWRDRVIMWHTECNDTQCAADVQH